MLTALKKLGNTTGNVAARQSHRHLQTGGDGCHMQHLFNAESEEQKPGRALTADEVVLAQSVFGDGIDYSQVRVLQEKVRILSARQYHYGSRRKYLLSS